MVVKITHRLVVTAAAVRCRHRRRCRRCWDSCLFQCRDWHRVHVLVVLCTEVCALPLAYAVPCVLPAPPPPPYAEGGHHSGLSLRSPSFCFG